MEAVVIKELQEVRTNHANNELAPQQDVRKIKKLALMTSQKFQIKLEIRGLS